MLQGYDFIPHGEHWTVDQAQTLVNAIESDITLCLTNSLLVAVTAPGVPLDKTSRVYQESSGASVFQTMGAGRYYLLTNSAYHGRGTPWIDPVLRAELRDRTTYVPALLSGFLRYYTRTRPTAPRNTNETPDIGYAYPALDWLIRGLTIQGPGTLIVTNGAAVGVQYNDGLGLRLDTYGRLISEGAPLKRNQFAWADIVQEKPDLSATGPLIQSYGNSYYLPGASFRFTDLTALAGGPSYIFGGGTILEFSHCQMHGGGIYCAYAASSPHTINLFNSLFEQTALYLGSLSGYSGLQVLLRNNLFKGGFLSLYPGFYSHGWNATDNLFDKTIIKQNYYFPCSYNAYITNYPRLASGSHDRILPPFNYQTGPLGNYYLPLLINGVTNALIDHGSRSALNAGLHAYTATGVDRDKMTVDIGLHFPFAPSVAAGPDQSILLGQTVSLCGQATAGHKGKILVAHDEWTLSDTGFGQGEDAYGRPARLTSAALFSRNIARWFASGRPGHFLIYSRNLFPTPYANAFQTTLTQAGHRVTVSTSIPFTLENVLPYDAIFLAGNPTNDATRQYSLGSSIGSVLTNYVNSGGSVYVAAGTSGHGESQDGAALLWNPFLHTFGLEYASNYNAVEGLQPVSSCHPLLQDIQRLYHADGNSVSKLDPFNPSTTILQPLGQDGLFATYAPSAPLTWVQIGGPAPVTFDSPHSAATAAHFTQAGRYALRLASDDVPLAAYDDVIIDVNGPPHVTARASPLQITLPSPGSTSLIGTAIDPDHLPLGRTLTTSWNLVNGPGPVRLVPSLTDVAFVNAHFTARGDYTFRFSASDSQLSAHADVTVHVLKHNSPPSVDGGPDQEIILPDLVFLPGKVLDDGLPGGPLIVQWVVLSKPRNGEVHFDQPDQPQTMARFDLPGVYVLSLRARDQLEANWESKDVTITVRPLSQYRTFVNATVVSAAVGGLRDDLDGQRVSPARGQGPIVLSGIVGDIRKAYLALARSHRFRKSGCS